jgi:type II secretory pathway pseudopilin PulG
MPTAGTRGRPTVPGTDLDDGGYIMVVLLIGMAVVAIWMSAALPAWRQQAVREKEAELIFRGEQYARAIFLYRQENNQAPPPNIDTLVNRRYLRKKYLDPMTGQDFVPVAGLSISPGSPGPGRGTQPQPGRGAGSQVPGGGFVQGQPGITGVRSTSTETSMVVYENQQVYNQFPFDWTFEAQRAGAMGPISIEPDGQGGTGRGRGGIVDPGGTGPRGGQRGGGFGGDRPLGRGAQGGRRGQQQPAGRGFGQQ